MTNILDHLQRLHEAATTGPWKSHGLLVDGEEHDDYIIGAAECFREVDGELIAAMRNALPALLRVARAARVVTCDGREDLDACGVRPEDSDELLAALEELNKVKL
jgi:hypothetical protein